MAKHILLALTLLSAAPAYSQKKVLFVMSAAHELPLRNGKTHPTGVFLSEFYPTFTALLRAGYKVDFATPGGRRATIDPESLKPKYWKNQAPLLAAAQTFTAANEQFNSPMTLQEAFSARENYAGLLIPGGQGLMADLVHDPAAAALLISFGREGKVVGLVCHAPALLLSIPRAENPFIGYRVNSVTRLEEWVIETFIMRGKPQNRRIARQLKKLGMRHRSGLPAANFALRDRHLVTSQNPYSNRAFTKCYLEALNH